MTLELGGQSRAIVCADADLDVAASAIVRHAFANSGQFCYRVMCGRRPHCKENLTFGLRSGASHVSGLFARHHDRWP